MSEYVQLFVLYPFAGRRDAHGRREADVRASLAAARERSRAARPRALCLLFAPTHSRVFLYWFTCQFVRIYSKIQIIQRSDLVNYPVIKCHLQKKVIECLKDADRRRERPRCDRLVQLFILFPSVQNSSRFIFRTSENYLQPKFPSQYLSI